ncbi:MAG: MATE family efflux transporter [Eubacteriales bacterium]
MILAEDKKIYKEYWKVALPASLEGVFLNLMLLADLAMIGMLGLNQVAAVGISSQPRMIFQMIGMAAGVAVTAIVARRKGEKNVEAMNSAIKQSLLLLFLLYTVILGLSLVFCKEILLFSGAKPDYIEYAEVYLKWILVSGFFRVMFAPLVSAQVGVGNTKIVLKANIIGNVLNVFLNYTLIFGKFGMPRLEIEGAAIATVIGNVVIFLILLASVLTGENDIDIRKGTLKFDINFIKPLLNIGSSSFFEHLWERVGLFIFARMIAELGTMQMGIHHYCILIWDLYYYFGIGMGTASSSFAGRMIGENRKDMAIIYNKVAQRSGLIISFIVGLLFIAGRGIIFNLLVDDNAGVMLGMKIMLIIAVLIIPQTYGQVSAGTLRGAGDNRFIAIYSMFVSAMLRPASAYIFAFVFNLGLSGMWLALCLDEAMKMFLTGYRIKQGIWLQIEI